MQSNNIRNHTILNEKGFTLLELIIVIMIIGSLSAIAVPRFANVGIKDAHAAN